MIYMSITSRPSLCSFASFFVSSSFLLVFLLIMSSISFSSDLGSSIVSVSSHNLALNPDLSSSFFNSSSRSAIMSIDLGSRSIPLNQSASGHIIGPSLLLDNLTHSMSGLSILIATGTRLSHLMDGSGKICDAIYAPTAGIACDLDQDTCFEYETSNSINYSLNLTLTFRNLSWIIPTNSSIVPVPIALLLEMENSSGLENLFASLYGNATLSYEVNDREFDGLSCTNHIETYSVSVPINSSRNFSVAGRQKLVFPISPILPEQWYRNNRFDLIILSQSPLYSLDNYINSNLTQRRLLRSFEVLSQNQSEFGGPATLDYQIILSHPNSTGMVDVAEFRNLSRPIPLAHENYSYSFIYYVNFSYSGYIGPNNLSINLSDSFLEGFFFERLIYSRMLSFGNRSENGLQISPNDFSHIRDNSLASSFGFLRIEWFLPAGFILIVFFMRVLRS